MTATQEITNPTTSIASDLDFVLLYVSDLDQAQKYFTDVIGLTHIPQADTEVFRGFGSDPSRPTFGICQPFDDTRRAGQVEIYFNTADFEGLHEAIGAKGVQTTPIIPVYFGKIFGVNAPDEHLVTIVRGGPPE
jgi:predicted enzyme related to lactoylglutathione lyase